MRFHVTIHQKNSPPLGGVPEGRGGSDLEIASPPSTNSGNGSQRRIEEGCQVYYLKGYKKNA